MCVRIGWLKHPSELTPRSFYLDRVITPRDLIQLMVSCIEAQEDIRFGIYHGLSANQHTRFDMAEARRDLGYQPQDDAYALARRHYLRRILGGRLLRWLIGQLKRWWHRDKREKLNAS